MTAADVIKQLASDVKLYRLASQEGASPLQAALGERLDETLATADQYLASRKKAGE